MTRVKGHTALLYMHIEDYSLMINRMERNTGEQQVKTIWGSLENTKEAKLTEKQQKITKGDNNTNTK